MQKMPKVILFVEISQIAAELGYDSDNHLARYFHQEKKMSPKSYRKKYRSKVK